MTYVLSDLHGVYEKFLNMLEVIDFNTEDTLYILGDVIDRGPESFKCLDRIMNTPNMKLILGNHEAMLLEYYKEREPNMLRMWYSNGGDVTDKEFRKFDRKKQIEILKFLDALPLCCNLTVSDIDYELVHGNYVFKKKSLSTHLHKDELLWGRVESYDRGPLDRIVIFGHTPTVHYLSEEKIQSVGHCCIWFKGNLIGIDCGLSGYMSGYPYSCLGCLCLETLKEYYV